MIVERMIPMYNRAWKILNSSDIAGYQVGFGQLRGWLAQQSVNLQLGHWQKLFVVNAVNYSPCESMVNPWKYEDDQQ